VGAPAFTVHDLAALDYERTVREMTPKQRTELAYTWPFWARPNQREPDGDWLVWMILAGRNFGKTRCGAEWVISRVNAGAKHIALIGRTAADVRDTMIRGESGILACSPPWNMPTYVPSLRRLTWPNGAEALTFSAEKPEAMRGPQPDTTWADELAAWKYAAMYTQAEFATRSILSGLRPRICVTTTPRPTPLLRRLNAEEGVHVTRGSTFDNAANMDPAILEKLRRNYEGSRIGRQELHGALLEDAPGALWKRERITELRVYEAPPMRVIVVAVDPAVTTGEKSNETGIIVSGVDADGHGYVLEDLSGKYSPNEWGKLVVDAWVKWKANRIIAEANNGGDLVVSNVLVAARDRNIQGVTVNKVHAAQGKRTRAEPIANLAEQGRIHHVGEYVALEDQQCSWEPDVIDDTGKLKKTPSPDRLDAYVWAFTDLMIDRNPKVPRARQVIVHGQGLDDRSAGYE
jgi:phage terminase large subunit-like protein